MRLLLKTFLLLLTVYATLLAGFYAAMCQGPAFFSRVMSHTPGLVFVIFPFRQMWLFARQGQLKVGDPAPDFSLMSYDKSSRMRLADLRGHRPVVLIFGSYT